MMCPSPGFSSVPVGGTSVKSETSTSTVTSGPTTMAPGAGETMPMLGSSWAEARLTTAKDMRTDNANTDLMTTSRERAQAIAQAYGPIDGRHTDPLLPTSASTRSQSAVNGLVGARASSGGPVGP